jgi:hypothetical protein
MPRQFRESRPAHIRERWPLELDLGGVPRDTNLRNKKKQELEETMRGQPTNFFVSGQSIDLNKPAKEAYRHQEYPKMVYHPTMKDPVTLKEHKRITLYNSLHPEKPELLPSVTPAFKMVNSKEEETAALQQSWQSKPPAESPHPSEFADVDGEALCSRGCGEKPHRGKCAAVAV